MKKTLMIVLAFVLVIAMSVAGTVAYLTSQTDAVVNTFTVGKVGVTLVEESADKDTGMWSAQLIPGTTYAKDPVVTVTDDSEDCYLFVKFEQTNNPADYLIFTSTLTVANGWTLVPDETNVWYRVVKKADTDRSWHLLVYDQVVVKASVGGTVAMPTPNNTPAMTYTAYVAQSANLTVGAAWDLFNPAA